MASPDPQKLGPDQKLVKMPRGKRKPAEQKLQSMDDIAARYHTPHDVIPGDGDPERRHRPSISLIELTADGGGDPDDDLPRAPVQPDETAPPDTHDGVLRTLEDLMARFPFNGDGQYYMYVKRVSPRTFFGAATYGQQRYIKHRIGIDEFIDIYGGGDYELIPYGPPRRGAQVDESGRVIAKALAKPIRITIPWLGDYATPPNTESVVTSENQEDEDPMEHSQRRLDFGRRGVHTPATAKMHETELTFEERDKLREREDKRREEERNVRDRDAAVGAVKSVAERTIEMLERQVGELTTELRSMRDKPNGITAEGIVGLVSAIQPKSEPDEIARMREQHRAELERLETNHRVTLEAMKTRSDEEMGRLRATEREELQRMGRKVEDAERESARRVNEAETRSRADVERARDEARKDMERLEREQSRLIESTRRDHERELNNMRTQHEQQLQVERGSYERERMVMKELSSSQVQTEKTVFASEISTLKSDLERTKLELAEAKRELEHKGSLVKQLGEFNKLAEQMGYGKDTGGGGDDEAPQLDWKALIATGGVELAKKLPEILGGVAQALQARGQQGQTQQRVVQQQQYAPAPRQMQPVMPAHGSPQSWQSEDTMQPDSLPMSMQHQSPVPTMPAGPPQTAFERQIYDQQQAMPMPEQQLMHPTSPQQTMQPPPMQQPPPVQERRRRRPTDAAAPPPQPAQAPPQAASMPISDTDMQQMQPQLEMALASGQTPAQVAAQISAQVGIMGVTMAAQVTAEAVATTLQRIGQAASPLARRDGQKFLKALQLELIKIRDSQGVST